MEFNAMKRKRMIMIGGWTRLYRKAVQCGFELTVVQEKDKIKLEDFNYIEQLITFSIDDLNVLDVIRILHQKQPFDCVVSMQEKGLLTAAYIQDMLQIKGNPIDPVLLTKDKVRMREHLVKHGLKSVPFKAITKVEDVVEFINRVGFPIILKPVYGTGSRQIHKITDLDQIQEALSSIQKEYDSNVVLAEKFMDGVEVSVESFTWDGKHTIIAVTDKMTTGSPYFVETGHCIPSSLPEKTILEIKYLTIEFLKSINHWMGPSHTEIIITDDGPYIIESHTRAGGDFIYDLVEMVYGVDMFTLLFEGLAGKIPKVKLKEDRGAAAIQYFNFAPGKITKIEGIEEVRKSPGIKKCQIDLEVGAEIKPFTNSSERYGYIIAEGRTKKEVLENIEAALGKLSIEVE
ncbi:hypothetical protein GS3922_05440 [Geobacillus subterraneus]|uniref:ATP-grasp domain-containing protein n=2 Tax=Geobacillus TaxID=129337 RepID=A0ABM6AAA2_9BACL|nr:MULTISPECIES: ATP-grasp domain-containing protein [Geobacillus]AMX83170.1 hypothetical protein GS3922_05440 [Geobacillus subterraneus]KZS26430.1 hypothetical protein A5418_01085 [Geobacillus subterraneus]OXB90292.1 hypothetical protein B9L21_05895 [Geobacillus uzenensis]